MTGVVCSFSLQKCTKITFGSAELAEVPYRPSSWIEEGRKRGWRKRGKKKGSVKELPQKTKEKGCLTLACKTLDKSLLTKLSCRIALFSV